MAQGAGLHDVATCVALALCDRAAVALTTHEAMRSAQAEKQVSKVAGISLVCLSAVCKEAPAGLSVAVKAAVPCHLCHQPGHHRMRCTWQLTLLFYTVLCCLVCITLQSVTLKSTCQRTRSRCRAQGLPGSPLLSACKDLEQALEVCEEYDVAHALQDQMKDALQVMRAPAVLEVVKPTQD